MRTWNFPLVKLEEIKKVPSNNFDYKEKFERVKKKMKAPSFFQQGYRLRGCRKRRVSFLCFAFPTYPLPAAYDIRVSDSPGFFKNRQVHPGTATVKLLRNARHT
jgi:hypothetical protein